MSNPNRGIELHIQKLKDEYAALDNDLRSFIHLHKTTQYLILSRLDEIFMKAKDIYIRSNMPVPEWCNE